MHIHIHISLNTPLSKVQDTSLGPPPLETKNHYKTVTIPPPPSSAQTISHELDLSTSQSIAIVLFCLSPSGKVAAGHYSGAKALKKKSKRKKSHSRT
jgi:hypothetical protein